MIPTVSIVLSGVILFWICYQLKENNSDEDGLFGLPNGSIGYLCSLLIITFSIDLLWCERSISPVIIGILFTVTIYYFRERDEKNIEKMPLFFPRNLFQILSLGLIITFLIINDLFFHISIVSISTANNLILLGISYFLGKGISYLSQIIMRRSVERSTRVRQKQEQEEARRKERERKEELKPKQKYWYLRERESEKNPENEKTLNPLLYEAARRNATREIKKTERDRHEEVMKSIAPAHKEELAKQEQERLQAASADRTQTIKKWFSLLTLVVFLASLILITIDLPVIVPIFEIKLSEGLMYIVQVNFGVESMKAFSA